MSEVRDLWDEGAPFHDEIYANNVPYHRTHEVLVDFLPKARPIHLLNLGAGTGTLARRILERRPESSVTCIAFSSKMGAECERKLARVFGQGSPGTPEASLCNLCESVLGP